MNALQSYLRHLLVTGLLFLVERTKLPIEGAEDAANLIALAVIGTVTWLAVKYGTKVMQKVGAAPVILALGAAGCLVTLPGCADFPLTLRAVGDGGALAYDEAGGLVVDYDARTRTGK